MKCLHLIFWPETQRRVHCHIAKPELNWRVTVNQVPLLELLAKTQNESNLTNMISYGILNVYCNSEEEEILKVFKKALRFFTSTDKNLQKR